MMTFLNIFSFVIGLVLMFIVDFNILVALGGFSIWVYLIQVGANFVVLFAVFIITNFIKSFIGS